MVSLSNILFAAAGALLAIFGWFVKGIVTSFGDRAATKLASAVSSPQFVSSEPSITDDELRDATEQFCTGLARRLHNRDEASYRPVIDPDAPYESAVEQRKHDNETVEMVHEDAERKSTMPSFEIIREGFIERGLWKNELTMLYEEAESAAELRELLIQLEELRGKL